MKRSVIIAALLLHCASVQAVEDKFSLELEFSHDQIPLSDHTELDVKGVGIRYSEGIASPLQFTLALGGEEASHDDDPLSLGYQPDGYYAGIIMSLSSPRWRTLQIGAALDYSYHLTDQDFDSQQLEIEWRRAEARGWLALQLNIVRLYGCAIAVDIDGTQTISGGTPSRIDFENEERSGYCGGIELETGDDGFIGIEAESRHQRGGRLYFGKRYGF